MQQDGRVETEACPLWLDMCYQMGGAVCEDSNRGEQHSPSGTFPR